jgi:outer membrane protein
MKSLFFCLILLMGFHFNSIIAQGTMIGVVSFDLIVQKSLKGKAISSEIKTFQKAQQSKIDVMITQYEDKLKDSQARAASMSELQKNELGSELKYMVTDIKRAEVDAQDAFNEKLRVELEKIQKVIMPLIRQVALEKGLDLVLNVDATSIIAFISDRIDITDDVIRKYNEM